MAGQVKQVRVVGCGYRSWALDILHWVSNRAPGVAMSIVKRQQDATVERIRSFEPDIVLYYGWSWMVPPEIVESYLCLGLHPSPLPKYRGGSPIQHQILAGEQYSAVSIFRMTAELDAGPLCAQAPFELSGQLRAILGRIAYHGQIETLRILREYAAGTLEFWPQAGEPTTFRRRLPAESEITAAEWTTWTAAQLYNKIRALQAPYPNAFMRCKDGRRLFLVEASVEQGHDSHDDILPR